MYKAQSDDVAGPSASSHTSESCGGVSAVLRRRREIYESQEEIEKFIIRQPATGEKDDYDRENSWISG